MKAIMISIQPKWVKKILNGEKTIEIRKTMPKCDLPIDVYIYCTKKEKQAVFGRKQNIHLCDMRGKTESGFDFMTLTKNKDTESFINNNLNGKVVAKFTLKELYRLIYTKETNNETKLTNELTCMTDHELDNYLVYNDGYGWHIDDLEIFDEPKELGEFYKCEYIEDTNISNKERHFRPYIKITKAPQSWQYIEVLK